ncbi:hypothetical protein [Pseudoalteromonas ruthenica]|uniref:hypothetical protein n=1 Tax=Pseudoalteromonas ruthenica TaxID=151081 RepID=UPI0012464CFD|nr:hypothetical protein [Pseudoalteromonas ruthenica]
MHSAFSKLGKTGWWMWVLALLAITLLVAGFVRDDYRLWGAAGLINVPLLWHRYRYGMSEQLVNPFEHIKVEEELLSVGEALFPVHEIRKVVIDTCDDKGLFQLPYNGGGQVSLVFDSHYVDDLKTYIKRTIPDAQIIT